MNFEEERLPPNFLYKYQFFDAADYSLTNLSSHQFYFEYPAKLNDPFDFKVFFQFKDLTYENRIKVFNVIRSGIEKRVKEQGKIFNAEEFDKRFLSKGKPNREFIDFLERGNEGIHKQYEQMGLTCFSERNDSILMWSHYSDHHRGFCLEFDTHYSPFLVDRRPFELALIKVKYQKDYPVISLYELIENEGLVHPLTQLAKIKWKDWKYEKEWRIISWAGGEIVQYDPSALSSIYFGMEIEDKDEERLLEKISLLPERKKGLAKRKVFRMKRSNKQFTVYPEVVSI